MNRITGLLFILSALLLQGHAIAAPLSYTWGKDVGGTAQDYAMAVAADNSGNVYVAGSFAGTANFGGSPLSSTGGLDVFIAKYDSFGLHLWSKKLGSSSDDQATGLATDAAGDVYVTGTFSATINLGDGSVTNLGAKDLFVVKFSSNGVFQWKQTGRGAGDQVPNSIMVDTVGNVHLCGYFLNSMGLGVSTLTSAGEEDMFVLEYSSSGTLSSAHNYGDSDYESLYSIATDASGNTYVFGLFEGNVDFGAGVMTSVGNANLALAKFNSAGQCQWSKRFGFGSGLDSGFVVTDSAGNIYIAGNFLCCLDFGGSYVWENGGLYDIYLAKFDPSGANLWTKDFGDNDVDFVRGLDLDENDNLYLYGVFRGTVDFGGGPLVEYHGTFYTPFLAELDSFGGHISSLRFKSDYFEPYGLSANADAVFVSGGGGSIDFGGGPLPFIGGNSDAYLARFTNIPSYPVITAITDVGGDQGKQVSIHFKRSGLDGNGSTAVNRYELYRKRDNFASVDVADAAPGIVTLSGWVFTGSIASSQQLEYVTTAPTLVDSTIVESQHFSTFLVRAATANPLTFFDSPPDSGYSVDNLAPPVPSSFAYQSGELSWAQSPAEDFDYFTVFGSSTNSFGAATVIDYTTDASMDVTASPYAYYFVNATDFSGNEGQAASLTTPTAVHGSPNRFTLSISAYPNPFNPQTTIRYTVPAKGRVVVDLFDARGSRVATLFDGVREIGAFTVAWNGEDGDGRRLSSGVYFARVTQLSQTRTYKLVLLK